MTKFLNGDWPILVVVVMFLILPLSTLAIAGAFEFIFVVLGVMALLIAGLIVAALVTSRRTERAEPPAGEPNQN